ncbi:DUF2911 domain-containing protein [Hwangdonia lutea]|uniref:DUF2911 domain-containing protein n=1 Tax=Hwangdonia lutea TaxID=3075823 RepID=A0AA97ENP1_9FLAO|nr:DUF2911 domain-containing protein [Hwangdonia sp. SCSIO 19198]WOD43729.1 DUF2911 domain-containing protein [Hwangdonia sp. SCSIO 19198]
MKKLLLILLAFTMSYSVNAQIETPQPSPSSKVEQMVGLTTVNLDYSRPGVKGRTVFGDLVPYGKVWRTGANARTKITFSEDVAVDGQALKAGSYAIFTIPQADAWDVVFYTDYKGGGAPAELDESKVAARVTAKVHPIPFNVETFTMDINNITNSSATLEFIWEKTYVAVPFTVPTDKAVSAAIEKTLNGPGFNDYYAAATYYLSEGKDIAKAKEWIDKAMSMTDNPRFWQLRQKSLIYAKAGDKAGAIAAAKKSLAAAQKAGNADYVKMNKDSLAEWGAM